MTTRLQSFICKITDRYGGWSTSDQKQLAKSIVLGNKECTQCFLSMCTKEEYDQAFEMTKHLIRKITYSDGFEEYSCVCGRECEKLETFIYENGL